MIMKRAATCCLLACVLGLPACAAPEQYWRLATSPVPLEAVDEGYCKSTNPIVLECAYKGVVTIRPEQSMECRACAIGHGAMHLAGYTHDPRPTFGYVIVCADGSTMVCK